MTSTEFINTYNSITKKLLLKEFVKLNVPKLATLDITVILAMLELYNHRVSEKDNHDLKLEIYKYLYEKRYNKSDIYRTNIRITGLYKKKILYHKENLIFSGGKCTTAVEYNIFGGMIKDNMLRKRISFNANSCVTKWYHFKKLIQKREHDILSLDELLLLVLQNNPSVFLDNVIYTYVLSAGLSVHDVTFAVKDSIKFYKELNAILKEYPMDPPLDFHVAPHTVSVFIPRETTIQ